MDYINVLDEQKQIMRPELQWWTNYLYHFTDVHNASNILYSGWIYSRDQATEMHVMMNDNASQAVIQATNMDHKCYGRLYFRPLTPTQFHNEGYKPVELRNSEMNACCPVPVFLCLNANATLNYPGTQFAERGIAGNRHNIKSGLEEFSKLNFGKIYHQGAFGLENRDIIEYRHSEVIHEGGFPIATLLECILCRTQAERETLLFLLKQYSIRLYNTYKDRVIYNPTLKSFFNNGIFIKSVEIVNDVLLVEFNAPEQRISKRDTVQVGLVTSIEVVYKYNGQMLKVERGSCSLDYYNVRSCTMQLNKDIDYDVARITIMFNDAIMYENEIIVKDMLF